MTTIDDIRNLLAHSRSQEAIDAATRLAAGAGGPKQVAMALYLRGNAHRQLGHWREAMNDYLQAIDLDPDGPATMAYRQAQEVLNFYHHDLYNP